MQGISLGKSHMLFSAGHGGRGLSFSPPLICNSRSTVSSGVTYVVDGGRRIFSREVAGSRWTYVDWNWTHLRIIRRN